MLACLGLAAFYTVFGCNSLFETKKQFSSGKFVLLHLRDKASNEYSRVMKTITITFIICIAPLL